MKMDSMLNKVFILSTHPGFYILHSALQCCQFLIESCQLGPTGHVLHITNTEQKMYKLWLILVKRTKSGYFTVLTSVNNLLNQT